MVITQTVCKFQNLNREISCCFGFLPLGQVMVPIVVVDVGVVGGGRMYFLST